MNKRLFYYLKKFKFVFFAIGLVLAFVGSFQYHFYQYSNPIKAITVVLYSTVKLFTFSPTSTVTNEAPLIYEIAVWFCPAITMVGFFSLFQKILQTIKFNIFHIGKRHLLLLGDNDNTIEFIKSVNREEENIATILLCDMADSVDEEKYKNLMTKVFRLDFANPSNEVNRMLLKDQKLGNLVRILCFEDEPKSFGLIDSLHKMKEWKEIVEVYVETKNYRIKELIEAKMDKLTRFDVHYFNVDELLVKKLMEDSTFTFNNPKGLNEDWSEKEFTNINQIADQYASYNLLIVGFSEIAEHFLIQATNLLTINPNKNLRVTVVDSSVQRFKNFVNSRTMIEKVIDYEFVDVVDEEYKIKDEVIKRHEIDNFSAALFAFDDVNKNIIIVDKLLDDLTSIPLAVYAKNIVELNTVIESLRIRHDKITAFGDKSDVINRSVIIREELLKKAKGFNAYYNKVMNSMMGWEDDGKSEEEQWLSLTNIKKESSAFQAAHRKTKLKLLAKFSELKALPDDPQEIIKSWKDLLEDKTVAEQVGLVEKNPILNFMTALEHKRWNNFYYMRDFVFDQVKDEYKKTHDCLIDDWEEFMTGKQRDKAIFDTLSSLSLFEDNATIDNNKEL